MYYIAYYIEAVERFFSCLGMKWLMITFYSILKNWYKENNKLNINSKKIEQFVLIVIVDSINISIIFKDSILIY